MDKKPKLTAQKRETFGKSVKKLRRQGILPGVVYGREFKSLSVQFDFKEFQQVYKVTGETTLIELEVSEHGIVPVLIKQVQLHPLSDLPLHIDFYKVDLTQKVNAKVPVHFIGESEAVKNDGGILIEIIKEVEVEALPGSIPSSFEVDISILGNIGDSLSISNLQVSEGVELKVDIEELICKIEEPKEEEVEETEETTVEDVEVEKEEGAEETPEEAPEEKKS